MGNGLASVYGKYFCKNKDSAVYRYYQEDSVLHPLFYLLGLLLLGGMVISIGMLISSLTESQFIAALGTFVVSFALLMIDNLKYLFNASWLATIVDFLSINQRYNDFTIGVIHYDDILFFLSMQVLFLFLTVRVLDRKRWS